MNYALIMAGGSGTRLWPLSRERLPKPALRLYRDESLFQIAIKRLEAIFPMDHILVVAGAEHCKVLAEQVPGIPRQNFLVEPHGRGTASAIGLAAVHLAKRDPEALMAVLTADHSIGDEKTFQDAILAAFETARQGYLVTLGIQPSFPSTDYGYIEAGEPLPEQKGFRVYQAKRFVEKPPIERAEAMLREGGFSWNSGMFIWKLQSILDEMNRQMPELYDGLQHIAKEIGSGYYDTVLNGIWPTLEKQTIDYGIMEGARKVAVIPVSMDWVDVGTWPSLMPLLGEDVAGNATRGDAILKDCKGSLLMAGGERSVVGIGLEDMIVVDSPDAILVCPRSRVGELRDLVKKLKEDGRGELL